MFDGGFYTQITRLLRRGGLFIVFGLWEDRMSDENKMDVSYVANLARVELTDAETGLFQEQLNQVLDYVEQLSELDVSNVQPTAHAVPLVNVFRADKPGVSLDNDTVVANAPASRDGQVLVPKINEQF